MAKKTYIVRDPVGVAHKRTSGRVYVAAVLERYSLSRELSKGHCLASYWEELWPHWRRPGDVKEEWVAAKTAEAHEYERGIAASRLGPDGDTYYMVTGWCGRLDLAEKLSAKTPGSIIVPVE